MTSCRLTDGGGMVVVYWCEMMRCEMHGEQSLTMMVTEYFQIILNCLEILSFRIFSHPNRLHYKRDVSKHFPSSDITMFILQCCMCWLPTVLTAETKLDNIRNNCYGGGGWRTFSVNKRTYDMLLPSSMKEHRIWWHNLCIVRISFFYYFHANLSSH